MRKVCIVTGTRADWGLLSGIAKALDARSDVVLQIVATNMHLSAKFGNTIREIVDAGLTVTSRVPIDTDSEGPTATATAMAQCTKGMAEAFAELRPDLLVILGDRFEMLATASAALVMHIPIVHIAGGAISEGAFDESIRHAITKMSHIHLVETEAYRRRVIQLGEDPQRVINTGAIGVYNIRHVPLMSVAELEESLGTDVPEKSLLVTFHPATLDAESPVEQCRNMLAALDDFPDYKVIFTYPNNDTQSSQIISLINDYVDRNRRRCAAFASLGMRRYLSALRRVAAVVGNSSSGIVEVPSSGIPTLNIGIRQRGRIAAESVVNCGTSRREISRGLATVLSPEMQLKAKTVVNPYEKPDTLERMVKAIAETPLEGILIKPFYDINQ